MSSLRQLGPSLALGVVLAAPSRVCAAQEIAGTWDVVRVAVDRKDQPHWLYYPDDPRLLGRELVIGPDSLSFNDGSDPCRQPKWDRRASRMSELIATSFPRERGGGPTLRDFGIADGDANRLTVHSVRCAPSSDGRELQPWNEAWFVPTASSRLLMRIGTSAVLTLQRRTPQGAARPSFSCRAASNDVEKLLCQSVPLAALDRSVTAAFERRLKIDDAATIRAQQVAWLKKRDACGANEVCLADAMRARIDELMQD